MVEGDGEGDEDDDNGRGRHSGGLTAVVRCQLLKGDVDSKYASRALFEYSKSTKQISMDSFFPLSLL